MQIVNLQITPTGVKPVIHVSQYDVERQFQIKLWDGQVAYNPPSGATIEIQGIKPDDKGFAYSDCVSISGNTLTVTTKQQMTIVDGTVECEIRFLKNSVNVGTLNFIMIVEKSPLNNDTDISETDLPRIIDEAAASATLAESFAKGGTHSRTGEDTDNSYYYKELAEGYATSAGQSEFLAGSSATSANTDALKAEGYAVGKQNGSDVPSQSPYYHNNAQYFSDRAAAYSLNVPYIGANGNWWVWNVSDNAYVDSGVDASITVNIQDITMLNPTETPYVINSGTNTDPVFHLYIPRGKGIASIEKTSVSGLVDTYTITYSDGYTTTFTVTNGKSAYQSAIEGGYQDSESKFENDLAHFGQWASDTYDNTALARQAAIDASNQANRAQLYADFIEPSFIIQNNRLYLKNDAVGEFIVENNRLYMRLIAS